MTELYRRLLRRVRSINGLNRVHIALDNILTPAQAWPLLQRFKPSPAAQLLEVEGPVAGEGSSGTIGEKLFTVTDDWRGMLEWFMDLAGKDAPEPFVRTRLRRDVFLFSSPERAADRRKRLLIVFGGGAQRPMMPMHVFLQHLDATTTDVMFLRDPTRKSFREGLFGVGPTIEDVIAQLPVLADVSSYESVSTMGMSGGGIPAVLAGLALCARSATAVGIVHPDSDVWTFGGAPLPTAYRKLRETSGSDTNLFLMCGAQSPQDQNAAQTTASILEGTVLIVSDDNPVYHAALFPLAAQRYLGRVLDALMSADIDDIDSSVPTIDISEVRLPSRTRPQT